VGVNIPCIDRQLLLILFIMALLLSGEANAAPEIISAIPTSVQSGTAIKLTGSGFGAASSAAKVIADYGRGFLYALEPAGWGNSRISVRVPDLGKSLTVKLYIISGGQRSKPVPVTIKPDIRGRQQDEMRRHQLSVGDKGEDVFSVSNISAMCGKSGTVFDHAEIVFDKKRFSDAQFVSLPKKGCKRCGNIRVRWYNEPTGQLAYRVNIFQRHIEGICQSRIRHH